MEHHEALTATDLILLPYPKQLTSMEGVFLLTMDTMIVLDSSCPNDAYLYAKQLQKDALAWAGLPLAIGRGACRPGDISLRVFTNNAPVSHPESHYSLAITGNGISLRGGGRNALGYAVQTLRQILRQTAGLLPCLTIEDEPDIPNRGFYHDVTRGRVQTLENLKKLADTMAFYKLNQLQLYVEHTYLFRDQTELWRDETPLTAEEILELDQYCYERGIELVPSLASFGHLYQLLRTKSYAHLCELPESTGEAFSFGDRMAHHTVNVSDLDSLVLIKQLIGEYMQLFRTDKFNLCADETFDLGHGKSRALAEEKGTGRIYLEYLQELFDFLIMHGKTPMFWGDIICEHPELYAQLPDQVICLNWNYSAAPSDHAIKALADAGASQYACPGVCGWNHWMNDLKGSYGNITAMCHYARQYRAIGVLNTDWGDYGHINQPAFSVPGMIYGAVCSWGENIPGYEELNRQISILEYQDASGRLVPLLGEISSLEIFNWTMAVQIKEQVQKENAGNAIRSRLSEDTIEKIPECHERLMALEVNLRLASRSMDSKNRRIVEYAHLALTAIRLWNEVGYFLAESRPSDRYLAHNSSAFTSIPASFALEPSSALEAFPALEPFPVLEPAPALCLAGQLERFWHHYKQTWQENGKYGDLGKIGEIFFWYADLLRDSCR